MDKTYYQKYESLRRLHKNVPNRNVPKRTKRRNMNTKQKRNLCIYIIMLLIAIILLTIFTIYYIQKNYKESLYDYTNQVIAKIVEEYPEQEEEIIHLTKQHEKQELEILINFIIMGIKDLMEKQLMILQKEKV